MSDRVAGGRAGGNRNQRPVIVGLWGWDATPHLHHHPGKLASWREAWSSVASGQCGGEGLRCSWQEEGGHEGCAEPMGGVPSRSGVAVGLRPGWCRQWGSMWHGALLMFRSQPLLSRGGTSTPCSPSAPWEQDPGQTYFTHIPSLQPFGNHSQAWADFPILPASSLQM